MAVEKMKLLSITGKDTDLEKFLAKNIINLDIQIEDAKKVYKKGWKLEYFSYDYTVKEYIKKCEKNRENGRRGGRPRNPEKPNGFEENPQ